VFQPLKHGETNSAQVINDVTEQKRLERATALLCDTKRLFFTDEKNFPLVITAAESEQLTRKPISSHLVSIGPA